MYGRYVQAKVNAQRDGYEIGGLALDEETREQFKRDYLDEDRYDESDLSLYGLAGDFSVRERHDFNAVITESGIFYEFGAE